MTPLLTFGFLKSTLCYVVLCCARWCDHGARGDGVAVQSGVFSGEARRRGVHGRVQAETLVDHIAITGVKAA
jgi:hypothetical protein